MEALSRSLHMVALENASMGCNGTSTVLCLLESARWFPFYKDLGYGSRQRVAFSARLLVLSNCGTPCFLQLQVLEAILCAWSLEFRLSTDCQRFLRWFILSFSVLWSETGWADFSSCWTAPGGTVKLATLRSPRKTLQWGPLE